MRDPFQIENIEEKTLQVKVQNFQPKFEPFQLTGR